MSKSRRHLLASALFSVLLITAAWLFFLRENRNLSSSVNQERIEYVTEIARQIDTNLSFMREEYIHLSNNYATILDSMQPKSISEINNWFVREHDSILLLADDQGNVTDLGGKSIFFISREFISYLGSNTPRQYYTSLSYLNDYWLFSSPLDKLKVEGITYTDLILGIPSETFDKILAIALFDQQGASYIIDKDGSLRIKPKKIKPLFNGYNFFTSLEQEGANIKEVEAMQDSIHEGKPYSSIFLINKLEWLITSIPEANSEFVTVIVVPLTITAHKTYTGFSRMIFSVAILVTLLICLGTCFLVYFYHRDRERSKEALATKAKSDFFSKMSHDIRTPLNAIIGMERIARNNAYNPLVVIESLDKSANSTKYLLNIIDDVLDMSRIDSGHIELSHKPFDINQVLVELDKDYLSEAREKGLRLTIRRDNNFNTEYYGDAIRVKQILTNLISNSLKFTQRGGIVDVFVSHIAINTKEDVVTFTVHDNGIGMSPEFLENIFTPFMQERSALTENYPGSGLGLSIVHELVTMMGGDIEVKSKLYQGSTFTVKIPFTCGSHFKHEEPEGSVRTFTKYPNKRALSVEDVEVNREILKSILENYFEMVVDEACDGEEAVNAFAESAEGTYDVIFMDIKMPVMDGLDATREIRKLPRADARTTPIIALTANAYDEDVQLSLEVGMNNHIKKPINVHDIAATLEKFLPQ